MFREKIERIRRYKKFRLVRTRGAIISFEINLFIRVRSRSLLDLDSLL